MFLSSDKDFVLTYLRRSFYYNQFFKKKALCNNNFLFSMYMDYYEAITKNIGPIISEIYMDTFCGLLEGNNTKLDELLRLNCLNQNVVLDEEIDCFVIELSGIFINDIIMESESNISVMKKRLEANHFSSKIANRIWDNVRKNINRIIDGQIIDEFFDKKELFQLKFEASCKNIENFLLDIELKEYEKSIRDDEEAYQSVKKYVLNNIFESYKDTIQFSLFNARHSENKDVLKYKNFYLSFMLDDINNKEIFINFTNAMKIGLRIQVMFIYLTSNEFKDKTIGRTQKATTKYKLESLIKKDNPYKDNFQFYLDLTQSLQASNTYLPLIIMANELHLDDSMSKTLANNLTLTGINKKSFPDSFTKISDLIYARGLFEKLIINIDIESFENPFIQNSRSFYSSQEREVITKALFNVSMVQIDDRGQLVTKAQEKDDDYLVNEKLSTFDEILEQLAKYLHTNNVTLKDIIMHNVDLKKQN